MKMADINLFPLPTGQFIVPWGALARGQRVRHNSPLFPGKTEGVVLMGRRGLGPRGQGKEGPST